MNRYTTPKMTKLPEGLDAQTTLWAVYATRDSEDGDGETSNWLAGYDSWAVLPVRVRLLAMGDFQ